MVAFASEPKLTLDDVGAASDSEHVEFRGVAADHFDSAMWDKATLHFVPDIRSPLLAPRDGKFRNIYAPSVIRLGDRWRVFFGGWDGSDSGNDCIYSIDADADFLKFDHRRTVIDHGDFRHVCNVNVVPTPLGYTMACTAFPDARGLNKPVTFFSKDAETWSASTPSPEHVITMSGYAGFDAGDINGMNVLLYDGHALRLYFGDFRNGDKTLRASSKDGRAFSFDGVVLQPSSLVNDVKSIRARGGEKWTLMALHRNTSHLFFSLTRDPGQFPNQQTLLTSRGDAEQFITSVGLITDDDRVLGVLYGAGAAASLDANRIFARWLQKKVVIDDITPDAAVGADRQLLRVPKERDTTIKLLAEDGATPIAISGPTVVTPGRAYQVRWPQTQPTPSAAERAATAR
jgi:hypothetical protein